MKLSLRWQLFRAGWRAWFSIRWHRILCKLLGHPKPYNKKMSCEFCPRCNSIMKYTGPPSRRIYVNRGRDE